MKRYMLDTNMVSHMLRQHSAVMARTRSLPMASLCMSSITQGELCFGLAKRPQATRIHAGVRELLLRVDVLPWTAEVAEDYGRFRAGLEAGGRVLAPLDLLIAAHAFSVGATLVSSDAAFAQLNELVVENWAQ